MIPVTARTRALGAALVIFAATLLAYLPAMSGGLIMDDAEHVTRPALRSVDGLARIWFEFGATAHYYPVLNTAFWLEHRLWGDAVTGYRLLDILLHATAACLVVAIVRRLALPGAWLAGLLYALHPVCVDTVAWISEQKNTLSAVFCLASALVYLRFDRDRRPARYALASALFVLALLTKTVTATLPPTLLVIFWWQRGRLGWRRDIAPLAPWIALGAGMGLLSAWFEQAYSGAHGAAFELSLLERCLVASRAICFYAAKVFWPADLMFINPRWAIDAGAPLQYLAPLAVLACGVALALLARRRRGPLAAFLVFAGTLFPTLGFLNINWFLFSYVADHFQYLACLALIVPAAAGLTSVAGRLTVSRPWAAPAAGAILLALLGTLTWQHSGTYRDARALYGETVARNPGSWLAHNNLATLLAGDPATLPDALAHYETALRLKPDHARAYNNFGTALAKIPGRLPDAIAAYRTALRLQHDLPEAHLNLANALATAPDGLPEALTEYQTALQLDPDSAEAHYNLGRALAAMPGRQAEAIAEYRAALRIAPDHFDAHNSLGNALAGEPARLTEAIAEYEAALRLKPDSAGLHNNLAVALAAMPGREADALREYDAALHLEPDYAEAHNNRGSLLAGMPGRTADAIAALGRAVELDPDYAEARYNLAVLLSAIPGRRREAIAHLQAALRLAPDDAELHNRLGAILATIPGRQAEAMFRLETALRLAPDLAEAHFNLAQLLLATPGRRAEAIAHLETTLRLRPDSEAARQMLARLKAGAP